MSPRQLLTRVFGFGLLAVQLSGCSAAADAAFADSSNQGGQTGSLIPNCLQMTDTPYVVPEGDTAFAQQVNNGLSTARLTDAMGNQVPVIETRDGATSILRTEQALTPGMYTLTQQCTEFGEPLTREITVVEAMDLPENFGTLEHTEPAEPPLCSVLEGVSLRWRPAADFVPYVNLTELTLFQGDAAIGVIPQAQPYELGAQGDVEVVIPLCPAKTTCLSGMGEYHVEARVAGEEGSWPSQSIELDPQCRPDPIDDGTGPCAVANVRARTVNTWPGYLVPLALWAIRRRTKRPTP